MDGELCRDHAIVLALELEGSPFEKMIGAIDREISKSRDPMVQAFGGMVSELFSGLRSRSRSQQQPQQRSGPGPRPRPSSPPPPRRPPPPPDPTVEARRVMGFDPKVKLTRELVQKRKQALARLFHPDVEGGSVDAMAAVNHAADVLLANLA